MTRPAQTTTANSRSPASGCYTLVSRNIHLIAGKYRVLITRRPKNLYGGRFQSLGEAISTRDALEAEHQPLRPWQQTPKRERHTVQMLRAERRAMGVCQSCGDEPPAPGCVTCQTCMDFSSTKRRLKRQEAYNDGAMPRRQTEK